MVFKTNRKSRLIFDPLYNFTTAQFVQLRFPMKHTRTAEKNVHTFHIEYYYLQLRNRRPMYKLEATIALF